MLRTISKVSQRLIQREIRTSHVLATRGKKTKRGKASSDIFLDTQN